MKEKFRVNPAALKALVEDDIENFMVAATPGGIEAQEQAGQAAFTNGDYLPKKGPRKELEALGFIFGTDKDDIFVYCQMSEGWHKVATDHHLWTELRDGQERKRGLIFYKAAFYDRSAHMSLERRYSYGALYGQWPETKNYDANTQYYGVQDMAAGEDVLFHTAQFNPKETDWKTENQLKKQAEDWLAEHYPEYKSPLAYWD